MILDGQQGWEFNNLISTGQGVVCHIPKYSPNLPMKEVNISDESRTKTISECQTDKSLI